MTSVLDRLNLRPQERKLVIFVALVLFVALNWFFVRPYFGELGRTQQKLLAADQDIKRFSDEIQRKAAYIKQRDHLAQQGGQVPSGEQATSLTREIDSQARGAGVLVQNLTPAPAARDGRTNSFFEEQALSLTFNGTGEPELVNFLFSLASQNSLIRVKSMTLRPDVGRMKLLGNLTLVESFQKKAAAKTVAVASASPQPAAPPKPVSAPPKVTNAPAKTAAPTKLATPLPASSGPPRTNAPLKRSLPVQPK